jgi:hypothetical protein
MLRRTRTCRICARDGTEVDIPTDAVTDRCRETRQICVTCLQLHIEEEVIEKGRSEDIHCICSTNCTALLLYDDVQKHATSKVFQAFDTRLFRTFIEKDPDFCWCARPGCGSGQLHTTRDAAPIMRCHECGFKTCFTHRYGSTPCLPYMYVKIRQSGQLHAQLWQELRIKVKAAKPDS